MKSKPNTITETFRKARLRQWKKDKLKAMIEEEQKAVSNEDVVEYALTYGLEATTEKFTMGEIVITELVKDFVLDNSDITPCECRRPGGLKILCFVACGNDLGISQSLEDRLYKGGFRKLLAKFQYAYDANKKQFYSDMKIKKRLGKA